MRDMGGSILPNYDAVILDECHTIESVASDHLGLSIGTSQIEYTLRKLYNPNTDKGLLVALGLTQLATECYACINRLADMVTEFAGWMASQSHGNGRVRQPRIIENILSKPLLALSEQLERFGAEHKDANVRQEMLSAQNRLIALANSLTSWLDQKATTRFIGWRKTKPGWGLGLPCDARPSTWAPTLRRTLFQKVPSVILTSATLAASRDGDLIFFRLASAPVVPAPSNSEAHSIIAIRPN